MGAENSLPCEREVARRSRDGGIPTAETDTYKAGGVLNGTFKAYPGTDTKGEGSSQKYDSGRTASLV